MKDTPPAAPTNWLFVLFAQLFLLSSHDVFAQYGTTCRPIPKASTPPRWPQTSPRLEGTALLLRHLRAR